MRRSIPHLLNLPSFLDTRPSPSATRRRRLSFYAGSTSRPAGPNRTSVSGSTTPCGGTSITSGWPTSPSSQASSRSSSPPPSSSSSGPARCGTSCGSCAASSWSGWSKRPSPASCAGTWWWCSCRCTRLSTWPACCLPSTLRFSPWTKAAGGHQAGVRWWGTTCHSSLSRYGLLFY